ncbi:MAG TPA: hypothetical protein VMR50_11110 [Myxococcota bacterium]|nr:hypothetical protein [Myxococcota bacterium]
MIPREPDAEARRTRAIVWSVFAVVCMSALGIFVYQVSHSFQQLRRMGSGAQPDPKQALDTSGLGAAKLEKIAHRFQSDTPKGQPGEKVTDIYALRLGDVDVDALMAQTSPAGAAWHRGDQLPPGLSDAVKAVVTPVPGFRLDWLPREDELRSERMYAFSWLIYYRGDQLSSVRVGFLRPSDHMFFYFSRVDPIVLLAEGMTRASEDEKSHSR